MDKLCYSVEFQCSQTIMKKSPWPVWLRLLGTLSCNQKVAGSVPGLGTFERHASLVDVSPSVPPSLPICLSKKSHEKNVLGWGFKKKDYGKEIIAALSGVAQWIKCLPVNWRVLRTKMSPVWFLIRALAWVAGQVPSWGLVRSNRSRCFSPSLSLSLPLSLKINKIF